MAIFKLLSLARRQLLKTSKTTTVRNKNPKALFFMTAPWNLISECLDSYSCRFTHEVVMCFDIRPEDSSMISFRTFFFQEITPIQNWKGKEIKAVLLAKNA
jgi:hypothetical protein